MKKNIFALIFANFIFTLTVTNLFAQGGSNYSIFGIGDIVYGQNAAAQSMGGTQIGVPSDNTINMLNPALWSLLKTTRVQTGYRFNQNKISSGDDILMQNNGSINGFASVFNFDADMKITAGFMLQPVSRVNYYMSSPIKIQEYEISMTGDSKFKGLGGLSNLTLGLGSKIFDWLYLGASAAAIVGKVEHSIDLTGLNISNNDALNVRYGNANIFSGASFKGGIFLIPFNNFGIGAFYQTQGKTNVESRKEYIYEYTHQGTIRDTAVTVNEKLQLPTFYGVGISYMTNKFLFATDLLVGNFSNLHLNKSNNNNFKNMSKFSVGIIKLGNPNQFATLTDRASYKFGAYYENLYYVINDEQISEYAITGGFQFPISRTAQVDVSVEFGSRGMNANGLIQESFGRLLIDISIGDTWFKPFRRD